MVENISATFRTKFPQGIRLGAYQITDCLRFVTSTPCISPPLPPAIHKGWDPHLFCFFFLATGRLLRFKQMNVKGLLWCKGVDLSGSAPPSRSAFRGIKPKSLPSATIGPMMLLFLGVLLIRLFREDYLHSFIEYRACVGDGDNIST